jgi:hypothetical protein
MGKLDPIVSEFETEEEAEAYDKWFRAQVEAALASTEPDVSHEQVMAEVREIIERHRAAQARLGG